MLAGNFRAVFVVHNGVPNDCSQEDIEEMVLQQMALETIFVAENLSIPDEEFQLEYDEAKREFGEHEYDDAKLREQVLENLKVPRPNSHRRSRVLTVHRIVVNCIAAGFATLLPYTWEQGWKQWCFTGSTTHVHCA